MQKQLIALVACLLVACSHDEESKLAPRAVLIDGETHALLTAVTPEGDLVFAGMTEQLASLEAGSVLLFSVGPQTPLGALRFVLAVTSEGDGLRVNSRKALLNEAFEELHLDAERQLTLEEPQGLTLAQPLVTSGVSFPFTFTLTGDNGRITVSGALAVAPEIDFNLELDIVKLELDELTLTVGASETFDADIVGEGSVTVGDDFTVATIPFTPIIFTVPTPAGAIPVVITPQVVVEVELSGTASAGFAASVLQDASISARVGYIDGELGGTAQHEGTAVADIPSYQGSVSLKAAGGPRFELLLYGAVGPYAEAQGTLTLDAAIGGPPLCVDWTVHAGADVDAGIQLFDDIEENIFSISEEIAAYDSCAAGALPPQRVPKWSASFARNGSAGELSRAIVEVSSGGYLVAGRSGAFNGNTSTSTWLVRLDPEGAVLWERAYFLGGASTVSVAEVAGGFVIATPTTLVRTDLAGGVVWAKRYTASIALENISIETMEVVADGQVVVGGIGGPTGDPFMWAMRVGDDGGVQWSQTYGGSITLGIRRLTSGELMLVGRGDGARLVRIGDNGEAVWSSTVTQQYDDNGDDPGGAILGAVTEVYDVIETAGGLTAVGWSYGGFKLPADNAPGFFAAWVVDLAGDGEVVTSTIYRATNTAPHNRLHAAAVSTGGSALFIGESSESSGSADLLLLQGGSTSYLRTGGDDYVYDLLTDAGGRGLIATRDGGFAITATSSGFGGPSRFWVTKLDRTGSVAVSAPAEATSTSGISLDVPLVSAAVNTNVTQTTVAVTITDITSQVASESGSFQAQRHSQ